MAKSKPDFKNINKIISNNVLELREHRTDKPVLGRISCQRACVNNERGDRGKEWQQNDDNNALQPLTYSLIY